MNKTHLFVFTLVILFSLALSGFSLSSSGSAHANPDTFPLLSKIKDFKGKNSISNTGIISFTTGLDNEFYQPDSIKRTGYFYVETKLAKSPQQNMKRVPLNISIVIDRSGSMEGVKLGNAKKAAKGILAQLKPEDYVSIVIYSTTIDSIQTPVHTVDQPLSKPVAGTIEKSMVSRKIDGITPMGATNLWEGTEKGYEFVQRNYKAGFINRVLLISDGLANVGLTDSNLIHLKVQKYKDDAGITISTFGVGLDYNERLMTDMAETGAGNYYFIDAADQLKPLFDKELNGLLNIAAQDAELRIKLPRGVRIEKAYPLRFSQDTNLVLVKLRDIFSGETKAVLFKFNIDDKVSTPLRFSASLWYTDVNDGLQKTISNENLLSPNRSVDAYLTHFNRTVVEQTVLYTANENLENAMLLVDRGDLKGANDQMVRGNKYIKLYKSLVKGSVELTKMDSINRSYTDNLAKLKNLNADSVKMIQKATRSKSYRVRNKKDQQ